MKRFAAGLLAGVLLGVLVLGLIPAGADQQVAGRRLATLEGQVARLEKKAKHLKLNGTMPAKYVQIGTGPCDSGDPARWRGFSALGHYYLGC